MRQALERSRRRVTRPDRRTPRAPATGGDSKGLTCGAACTSCSPTAPTSHSSRT